MLLPVELVFLEVILNAALYCRFLEGTSVNMGPGTSIQDHPPREGFQKVMSLRLLLIFVALVHRSEVFSVQRRRFAMDLKEGIGIIEAQSG